MLFWLPCLLLWYFLIQFLSQIDAKCSSGKLASSSSGSLFNSYSKLMQNAHMAAWPPLVVVFLFEIDAKCSSGCLAFSCGCCLFNSYSKMMQNAHLPCLLVCWFLIQFSFKIDAKCSWLACLLPCRFLIQFSLEFDVKCFSVCLASSCGSFLFNSYPKLMQNALQATLPPRFWLPCLFLWRLLIISKT